MLALSTTENTWFRGIVENKKKYHGKNISQGVVLTSFNGLINKNNIYKHN